MVLCITLTGPPDRTVCVCVCMHACICMYALSSTFMQNKTKDHKWKLMNQNRLSWTVTKLNWDFLKIVLTIVGVNGFCSLQLLPLFSHPIFCLAPCPIKSLSAGRLPQRLSSLTVCSVWHLQGLCNKKQKEPSNLKKKTQKNQTDKTHNIKLLLDQVREEKTAGHGLLSLVRTL